MKSHLMAGKNHSRGSALIIVLSFLFLLTVVAVAFLSRALLERQLSNASLNQNKIDLVAQGATASIIGDLQQEIVAGSQTPTTPGVYIPTVSTTIIPAPVGYTPATGDHLENLLKVSKDGQTFFPAGTNYVNGTASNRASNINTYLNPSLNSRLVTPARWNKPLLLTPNSSTDLTPTGTFPTPDWIYVASADGSNPTAYSNNYAAQGSNPVNQRYAYAIYDEGSTLDMNVAGSPVLATGATVTYTPQQPYKNALAYADLTQLPGLSALGVAGQQAFVNGIVGWRNHASGNATGNFPLYNFTAAVPPAPHPFDAFVTSMANGFLSAGGNATQSDSAFASRQQLLQFLQDDQFDKAAGLSLDQIDALLPYLGTFSRDISQPSYAPPAGRPKVLPFANGGNSAASGGLGIDDKVNPSFLSVTVTAPYTRNDGSTAVVGEPLVKKRFALNRLAWLTYEGPSATVYASNQNDANLVALINDGIPATFLQQGTPLNILNYFGLTWRNNQWNYNDGSTGPIQKITALTTPHDPNFFELLKASIGVGSIAKALAFSSGAVGADIGSFKTEQPTDYNYYAESSVDFQILQIGANMIDQFQPANYPVQIFFDDGINNPSSKRTIVGIENLPYLSAIANGVLLIKKPAPLPHSGGPAYTGTTAGTSGDSGYTTAATDAITSSGVGVLMQVPVIWNPHDPLSPVGVVGPSNFRVLADSAPPDVVVYGGTYNTFLVYAYSAPPSSPSYYSYSMAPTTGWSTAVGPNLGTVFKNPTAGQGNAEIDFSTPAFSPTKELCPEPFALMRFKGGIDSNGNTLSITLSPNDLMLKDPALPAGAGTTGFKSYIANAPNFESPEVLDVLATGYIGFDLGAFPLAWNPGTGGAPVSAAQSGAFLAKAGVTPGVDACYMTYRMQYKDINGNWVTYDTKYGKAYNGNSTLTNGLTYSGTSGFSVCPPTGGIQGGTLIGAMDWGFVTDPRTSRFGIFSNTPYADPHNSGAIGSPLPGPEQNFSHSPLYWNYDDQGNFGAGWLDTANGTLYTLRPDGQSGFFAATGWPSQIGTTSGWMAYLSSNGDSCSGLAPGLLSQNNTDIIYFPHEFYGDTQGSLTSTPNYFADPDGIVRRGMGAYVPMGNSLTSPQAYYTKGLPFGPFDTPSADTTVGLPMARVFGWKGFNPSSPNVSIQNYNPTGPALVTSQAQSRPYFLHRPFNSVAELGHVFSDTPWRNLDFFTAESGNAALLDIFCINDTTDIDGLVAGKVNLNTRQTPVLQAIIAGGYLDPVQPTSTGAGTVGQIDSATANLVAQALVARTSDITNISNGTGPLENVSELVGKWQKNVAINNLGAKITGTNKGTLTAPNFYDGKLSYAGFSGGVWDTANQKPYVNGVEDFTSASGAAKAAGTAEDVYSAYHNSPSFATSTYHSGTQETVTYIQRFREAPIRALSAAGTTRVWNLMIDVIAQTGRFPASAATEATPLAAFNVEGERRYWVHVALDRLTGKVLDEQVEEVKE